MGGVNEAAHILSLMGGQAKITLFDQEKIAEIHDYSVAKAARQEDREEGIRVMASTLRSMSVEQRKNWKSADCNTPKSANSPASLTAEAGLFIFTL